MQQVFLNHIEWWLSVAALLVIVGAPMAAGATGLLFWQIMASVAIAVGMIHAGIFWTVRRRQQRVREQTIAELRQMLSDVVKNQLTVIDLYLPEKEQMIMRQELNGIRKTLTDIGAVVETLSDETVRDWKARYDTIPHAPNVSPGRSNCSYSVSNDIMQ
ncbi:hypothetical protein [Salisaeta longa]|uniref:hypothetical protein n=1 Tax=Salisaeta longa TaxID=503170 RepID=UPI0012FC91DB|nr:hypothetical protein [Salisaeta longa]